MHIVIVGLGYVGLPLAVALAKVFPVTGFDLDAERVSELQRGQDRTREVEPAELHRTSANFSDDRASIAGADVYIVTVPTPVDGQNSPDLSAVIAASRTIGSAIDPAKRPTIVFESTVYPGVTEDVCGREIEIAGDLRRGADFRLGYSPERVNPGDQEHRIEVITKVIAGEDEEVLAQLDQIYSAVTSGGVFRAASIRTAEAAKAIENAQRDINIAFMNEVAQILQPAGLSIWDVLAAARTKWNFLPFEPGLVGGHCIGVDPYYLSHLAQSLDHHPRVILAGRDINDGMGTWVADRLHEHRGRRAGRALVLGVTFKENVPDIRNSKVVDLVRRLGELGHQVDVADPLAAPDAVADAYGFPLIDLHEASYDLVVGAVPHDEYRSMEPDSLARLVAAGGTIADLKGMWKGLDFDPAVDRWSL
jgi:UDP-N-acetyl-D-galactosamine dehydrogenase